MDYFLITLIVFIAVGAYLKGRIDERRKSNASFDIWKAYYEERIKNMRDHITEINKRSENWKNKIAEAKQTFKNS